MATRFEAMKPPEVPKVSKGAKRGFDTPTVKSVTPYRVTPDSDTSLAPAEVSEGFDTPPPRFTLVLQPASGNWKAPVILRLRALVKVALRGYGLKCTRAIEMPPDKTTEQKSNL